MSFDPVRAATYLGGLVSRSEGPPEAGWPFGAPRREFTRSPAAYRVAELAAEVGLGLFHYEWRHHLALPEAWVPAHDPALADPPTWSGGVLPERKYQSFRHDQAIGGFHPGMRAKWATHELCHGLVGFAWHPGASPLFVATASRLSELLPVALWYFLDEAHLQRCQVHANGGALYRHLCQECEALAGAQLDEVHAELWLERGRAFIEGELLAIGRTLDLGRPVPHVYGSLNLCSDGLAYAAAHLPRLRSEAFDRFAAQFLVEGGGWVRDLHALHERVLAVVDAVTTGADLVPLAPSPDLGRCRWTAQDLAWRLLTVWEDTDGDAARELSALVDRLAAVQSEPDRAPMEIAAVREGYQALYDEIVLPQPEAVFAVGYDVSGLAQTRSAVQIQSGVAEAVPLTASLLEGEFAALLDRFVAADRPVRAPIGRRFATFALWELPDPLADLVRYEAELLHLPPADNALLALGPGPGDEPVQLAPGVRILSARIDVVQFARDVAFGDVVYRDGQVLDVDGAPVPSRPVWLVLVRDARGEPQVLDVDRDVAVALLGLWNGSVPSLNPGVRQALDAHGVLVPVAWEVHGAQALDASAAVLD